GRRAAGHPVRPTDFSLAAVAAAAGRFARPSEDPTSILSSYGYGLHLDTAALAAMCRGLADGVTHHEARFAHAIRAENGHVRAVALEGGAQVAGDIFLDCSGPAALLCEDHGFESWAAWLRCDRVIGRTTAQEGVPPPYTHISAHPTGWLRSVPLAGGPREALLYSSAHRPDMPGASTIHQGRRTRAWTGNVIAVGAAAALIEPLYGHNLQMVQTAIQRLIALFPTKAEGPEAREYNRLTASETDRIRDFLVAHYKTNGRTGEPFWDEVRTMAVPDTLQYKLDLYASRRCRLFTASQNGREGQPCRIRHHRHGRRRRSDDPPDPQLQRTARHRRERVPRQDAGHAEARHRFPGLAP
ncbi:MAG: hypothetical protein EOP58_16530, partial [Sphingomonadales bacterium]